MNTVSTDIVVIGTGTAGATLALQCRSRGKEVLVVDERPYGGTCAMRGCQPKKFLVAAAEVAHMAHQMQDAGIHPVAGIDWPSLIRSKNAFTDAVPAKTEKSFGAAGVGMLHGTARFVSPGEVMVGETTRVCAGHIVLATGSRPAPLGFPGEEHVLTSDDFLNLPAMPKRVLFVGGGFISLEFAHVAKAAGADVTICHRSGRVLNRFDEGMVDMLMQSVESLGIRVVLNYEVCRVEAAAGGWLVSGGSGCSQVFEADLVVHGAGRVPNLESLDLKDGSVEFSRKGVETNAFLQSVSNPRVYAVGDCVASGRQLATTADQEAAVAAKNILEGNTTPMDYEMVPSSVFTTPPLAGVGMTELEAGSLGRNFRVNSGSTAGWPSSRRISQKHSGYKVLIENGTDRILGAHLFGHNASEVVNLFALAIKHGIPAQELLKIPWAYPTSSSDIKYMVG